jgi:hypothetical protein
MYANVTTIKRFQMSSRENTPVLAGGKGGGWGEEEAVRTPEKGQELSPRVTRLHSLTLSHGSFPVDSGRQSSVCRCE